jgi:glycosyltransferase involved in cell wall biosynthesis
MKILIVSSYLPFPLMSGGQIRLYNLIKELSLRHEISLICEIRANQMQDDIDELKKICKKVITVKRRKQWSFKNIVSSGLSQRSFLSTGHTNEELRGIIAAELKASTYDLIHVETYYVADNLPQNAVNIPVVLVEHNIEYKVYEKFARRIPKVVSPLLFADIVKIKKEEERLWKRAKAVVAVSQDDANVMAAVGVKAHLVPNGVDTSRFPFKTASDSPQTAEKRILYIGDFSWIQNTDAVTYIIKDIWPEIKKLAAEKKQLNISLWIVGRTIPEKIKALSSDKAIVFDEASSQKPAPHIFQTADVLLAPIRVGGGTSYKILESLSSGTPVVTMPMSARAIAAVDDETILVGDNAETLARKTILLLENKAKYETIAKAGRKLIEANYTWPAIAQKLEEVYQSVLE